MKTLMTFMGIISFIASLFGCSTPKDPVILDGPGMEYVDADHRSVYANALELDWESVEGYPLFAAAYLGSGDEIGENRDMYLRKAFKNLSDEQLEAIPHFDFGGDNWYLVVPRYDITDVTNTDTEERFYLNFGEAFTANCDGNLIAENYTHGGCKYTPMLNENGKLVTVEGVVDITDFLLTDTDKK